MKLTRFKEPQILSILRQAEGGVQVPELCREHRGQRNLNRHAAAIWSLSAFYADFRPAISRHLLVAAWRNSRWPEEVNWLRGKW